LRSPPFTDTRVVLHNGFDAMSPVEKGWRVTFLQLEAILAQHASQEESEIFNTARYAGSDADQSWM